jgi:hypothetical protein
MDSVNTLNTENVEACPFLTLASNNTKAMSSFILVVKDACNYFATDVYYLIGDDSECSDSEFSDSECCDSEYSGYSDSESSEDTIDLYDELSRKITSNEFESIILELQNKLDVLKMTYLAAKVVFHDSMTKEIAIFKTTT